jgi:flagellar biosynthetic protein FlhB
MAEAPDDEDRTEEPSQRRLEKARAEGNVPRSLDTGAFLVMSAGAAALAGLGGIIAEAAGRGLASGLARLDAPFAWPGAAGVARDPLMFALALAAGAPLLVAFAAGLFGALAQHGPTFTARPLAPKASRLSPLANAGRLFGKEAAVPFLKGLAKAGCLAATALWAAWDRVADLVGLIARPEEAQASALRSLAVAIAGPMLMVFALFAIADFAWSRHAWRRKLRMTRRELKDEHKESEGSPEVKGRLRQLRAAMARRRIAAAVPTASVVVMNPTHVAVALRWEAGMRAPVCVAKGMDALALRIREIARAHRVPVVTDPPLARALHAGVEIDAEIPAEHYRAVAGIIGFVLRTAQGRA